MRILLIRPPVPRHTIGLKHVMVCEPLELEYVAAGAVGHDVKIFDMILERGLDNQLQTFRPDIVATSCYITGVNEAIKVCRAAKRYNRDCFTIVGGVHSSVAPEDFADPSVDCIALGDGASLMPQIIDAVAGAASLADIPNLALPSGPRSVVRTRSAAYMPHPDALPFPRRDLTAHLRHRYYYLFHQPVAIMKTTWGCWYNCGFCMTWKVTGGMAFSRSPGSIVAELEQISETEVYIVDDIFLINQASRDGC
ncbi:MAG: cobalamin-dependent protein [candidate division Zixibacteria bacterium]|nr:cobalamin-dependent protein [candidate division Zixibacteria bacterium]